MKEYHINVALNGLHLFRTAWDTDLTRVRHVVAILQSSMPLAKVSVYERSPVMTIYDPDEFLTVKGNKA